MPSDVWAATHGMSPREGYVKTSTGAPIPYIRVAESTDTCIPVDYWAQWSPGCAYPYDPSLGGKSHPSCYTERSVRTDENGYYYFPPDWPLNINDRCDTNHAARYTCSNPKVLIGAAPANSPISMNNDFLPKVYAASSSAATDCVPIQHRTDNVTDAIRTDLECNPPPQEPPACGVPCFRDDECAGAKNDCTKCIGVVNAPHSSALVPPNQIVTKPGKCGQPPACGVTCTKDDECTGARNGCTSCLADDDGVKKCTPAPACNTTCTRDDQCAGVKDGCTLCLPSNTGTGKSCQKPPACGVACTKDAQCEGAKDGCTICTAGKCSAFSENMCGCDGMDFAVAGGKETFFPGDTVDFIAFGVVPGKDWKGGDEAAVKNATITSIQLALYQSSLTNPDQATRLAQSTAITPEIIENSGGKVRYKVTWNQKIPSTVPSGSLFRVQATIKCSAKPGVLGAQTQTTVGNFYSDILTTIQGLVTNTKTVLGDATDNQQADTFFPGAKISEKSCNILKFYFD